jgi:uncharacterized protein
MQIVNLTRGQTLARAAWQAESPLTRLVGLLGRRALPDGGALILQPCSGIHMLGMRFAIDALYLDDRRRVVRAISKLAPWRFGPLDPAAACVVELPAGTLVATGTQEGDQIAVQ